MLISLILCFLLAATLGNKVLTVTSETDLAKAELGGFTAIHLRADVTLGPGWNPVNFGGTINGFGHTLTITSQNGAFDTLSSATIMDLIVIQKSGSTNTGALAKTAGNVFMTGCVVTLNLEYGASYSPTTAAGLFTTIESLTLIGCTITISSTATGGNAVAKLGGLAVTCGPLSITECNVVISFQLTTSPDMVVGGLAATASSLTVSGCTTTFTVTYTGSGGITMGGLVGTVKGQDSIISKLTVRIPTGKFTTQGNVVFGAVMGRLESRVSVGNSAVSLGSFTVSASNGCIGGFLGQNIESGALTATAITVSAEELTMDTTGNGFCQYGGLAGTCISCSFSNSLFRAKANISSAAQHVHFGGALGFAQSGTRGSSLASVNVTVADPIIPILFIGGFVGNNNGGSLANLIANMTANITSRDGGVGGIAGQSLGPITACSANVTMELIGPQQGQGFFRCAAGAIVGLAKSMTLEASFGVMKISGNGATFIGGLFGVCSESVIRNSFVLLSLSYNVGTQNYIGGLIAYATKATLSNCYGNVTANVGLRSNTVVGGIIGQWQNGGAASNVIMYGSMVFTGTEGNSNIGTLVGFSRQIGTLTNCFSALQMKTYQWTMQVTLIGRSASASSSSVCAQLGNVAGCVPASNFKSLSYFTGKGMNVKGVFGSQDNLMNGYIIPTSLPVPSTDGKKFILVNKTGSQWDTNSWSVSGSGLPTLSLNYGFVCALEAGCHGAVTSSGSITCTSGWTGNATHPCSTFSCTNNNQCNSGTCTVDKCTCQESFTGLDCTQQPCGPNGKLVKGVCVCNSGEYFLNSAGQCTQGCPGGCGNGTCTGQNQCSCFAGYQAQNGIKCLSYSCNLADPTCFGVASCVQSSTLSGNYQCRCADKTEYFVLGSNTGKCVMGCSKIEMGYCTGPNNAVCEDGWVSDGDNLCSKYDCTRAPAANVCGGAGTCSTESKTCTCASNAELATSGICVFQNCTGLEHGVCKDNMYTCNPGWENDGGKCNKYNCAVDNSPSVCGNAGTCNKATKQCKCAGNATAVFTTSCRCNAGWYSSGGLCNMYNCSEASAVNLCNGLGFCTANGACSCLQTAAPVSGTCESVAGTCGACQNGNCLYDATTAKPQCVCSAGYGLVGNTCYQNNCGVCGNGTCTNNDATKTITCTCNDGFRLINGVCYKDVCGTCANGTCLADPASLTLACRCNVDFLAVDGICFFNDCLACTNGTCVPDASARIIACTCSDGLFPVFGVCVVNKGPLIVKIVVPIVVCVSVVVIIIVVVAVVCVRKSRKQWAVAPQPTEVRKFGDFSGTSTIQSARN